MIDKLHNRIKVKYHFLYTPTENNIRNGIFRKLTYHKWIPSTIVQTLRDNNIIAAFTTGNTIINKLGNIKE